MRPLLPILIASFFVAPAAACADQPRELTVFAAASLREAFEDLAHRLESQTPGLTVRLNFAASQELRAQIEQGARADIFASADLRHMATLEKAGLVAPPRVFARNQLVVVVPRANPAGVHAFADLPSVRRLVVAAPEVPVGAYTRQILARANAKLGPDFEHRVLARVVSNELNVRQVLAKVSLGEADAGVVYRTDALAARDRVEVVPIPAELNVIADYPIAALKSAPQPRLAQAFVDLVLSAEGQQRLAAVGFAAKPPVSR